MALKSDEETKDYIHQYIGYHKDVDRFAEQFITHKAFDREQVPKKEVVKTRKSNRSGKRGGKKRKNDGDH